MGDPTKALPLYEPDGKQLRIGDDDRGGYADMSSASSGASVSGSAPRYSVTRSAGMGGTEAPGRLAVAKRKLTDEELNRIADQMLAEQHAKAEASLASGPSVRRAASGSPMTCYDTELTKGAEDAYKRWHDRTSPWDTGEDYDLRGAFAAGLDRDGRGHLPDTFKKPNHPTFSDESQYADFGNPGHWSGDSYVPGPVVHDPLEPAPWLQNYMDGQEATDPYHPPTMTREQVKAQAIKNNPYMSEQDKLGPIQ